MAPVVLVTGTSSGLGAATAERLAHAGWTVLAGVRRVEDGASLRGRVTGDVRPLLLDVTDDASLERAVTTVEQVCGGRGLRGLVSNAGVPLTGPVEFISVDQWRALLEVNLLGAVALTTALFDQVRIANGRFVYVGCRDARICRVGVQGGGARPTDRLLAVRNRVFASAGGAGRSRPISRILSPWLVARPRVATISLGRRSPDVSCGLPGTMSAGRRGPCSALLRVGHA